MENQILNMLDTPVFMVDKEGIIFYENETAKNLLGTHDTLENLLAERSNRCPFGKEEVCTQVMAGHGIAGEFLDSVLGYYWHIISKKATIGGKDGVLVQLVYINIQKIFQRRFFSYAKLKPEIIDYAEQFFMGILDAEYDHAIRSKSPTSLILFSIKYLDGYFKEYGMEMTNLRLQQVGTYWLENIRTYDYGLFYTAPNTYGIIFPNTKESDTTKIVNAIFAYINDHLGIPLMVGLASSKNTSSAYGLSQLAKRALYVASQEENGKVSIG